MRFTVKALRRHTIDFCVNGLYVFNSSQLFLIDHPLRRKPAIYAAESYSSAVLRAENMYPVNEESQLEWRLFTVTICRHEVEHDEQNYSLPHWAWDSSSQVWLLMRNFVSLASEAMRWGSEGWWGENTFSASKGLSGSDDPARRPVLNWPSCAGEAVCLPVVVARGQYLQ